MSHINRDLNLDTVWNLSWEQSKKHAWSFILLYICIGLIVSVIYSLIMIPIFSGLIADSSLANDPDKMGLALIGLISKSILSFSLGIIAIWMISSYFRVVLYRMLMDVVKGQPLSVGKHLTGAWNGFLWFLAVTIVLGIVMLLANLPYIGGNILITMWTISEMSFSSFLIGNLLKLVLIIPYVYVQVRLLFVPLLAAYEPELTLAETFSKSWNLTRGHFWTLLGIGLVAVLINIIGFCCCCIGILFTIVIAQFMLANVYYILSHEEEEPSEEETLSAEPESVTSLAEGNYSKEEKHPAAE
ncbi:MAG: hypothetical protein IJ762_02705 [Bacteroidaceae bacterium]|nr:hypothetical protein [Bacteroidaceae bacterium]MBR1788089.1 hypothetical protein [Bacteroidaceae bacterium]